VPAAAQIGGMTLRSLDAIHLATAASISRQLGALITYDSDLQAEPSVGLEPTTPSLPWKGRGVTSVHGRSQTGTKSLQIPTMWDVRPWCPICARSRSSGRGVDALHSPVRLPNLQG